MKFIVYDNSILSEFNHVRNRINLGDNIQFLAVKELLLDTLKVNPNSIIEIGLDDSKEINRFYEDSYCFIAQGHYSKLTHWDIIKNKNIKKYYIGFGLMDSVLNEEDVELFKGSEPILCRDEFTKNVLHSYGIDAYLFGCLTLTLEPIERGKNPDKFFFVDVDKELIDKLPENIKRKSVFLSQNMPIELVEQSNEMTIELFHQYAREAEIVFTSKLHCMCPCVAMGIPVVAMGKNFSYRYSFCDKLIDMIDNWNNDRNYCKDISNFPEIKEKMKKAAKSVIEGNPDYSLIEEIDTFFSSREQWNYLKKMKKQLKELLENTTKREYVLWGASAGGYTVFDCINMNYEEFQLKAVVDSFTSGIWEGKIIERPDIAVEKYRDALWIITTLSGKDYALEYLKSHGIEATVIHESI